VQDARQYGEARPRPGIEATTYLRVRTRTYSELRISTETIALSRWWGYPIGSDRTGPDQL